MPYHGRSVGRDIKHILDGTISNSAAKEVFRTMWVEGDGGNADDIVQAKGLKQVSDSNVIEGIVEKIIADNPAQVAEYRNGKDKMLGFYVGLTMKASKGKANPAQLNEVSS